MAAHKTNGLLKYGMIVVGIVVVLSLVFPKHSNESANKKLLGDGAVSNSVKNTAANDSAAESLDTLTAELASTKQQVEQISKDNDTLKKQNHLLTQKGSWRTRHRDCLFISRG